MEEEVKIVDSPYQTKGYLCYLGILILVPLLTVKKEARDEFIDCHIKQGMGLLIVEVLATFIRSLVGSGAIAMLFSLISLFCVILAIMGLVNVSKKKIAKLPLFGDMFSKINM
ncbi:MAG: hypothetical protein II956_05730 [Bacteroidales bacterium]|nr:hypothetical protein [Bacteroidales bacterium]